MVVGIEVKNFKMLLTAAAGDAVMLINGKRLRQVRLHYSISFFYFNDFFFFFCSLPLGGMNKNWVNLHILAKAFNH